MDSDVRSPTQETASTPLGFSHSGHQEHDSGCPVEIENASVRVEPGQPVLPVDLFPGSTTSGGPLCHEREQSPTIICLTSSGSDINGDRCLSPGLESLESDIPVSTDLADHESFEQVDSLHGESAPSCTLLAEPVVVSSPCTEVSQESPNPHLSQRVGKKTFSCESKALLCLDVLNESYKRNFSQRSASDLADYIRPLLVDNTKPLRHRLQRLLDLQTLQ